MYKIDVIGYFGGVVKLADALKITHGAVSQWGEIIPQMQALRIDKMTSGGLVYNSDIYVHDDKPELRNAS